MAVVLSASTGFAQSKATESSGASPSGSVVSPELIQGGQVAYPEGAEVNCRVHLKLLISVEGGVTEVEVEEVIFEAGTVATPGAREVFEEAAVASVRSWMFSPAKVEGTARAAYIRVQVEFQKPEEELVPEAPSASFAEGSSGEETGASKEDVVSVKGARRPGTTRVLSDAESEIVVGAEGDPLRAIEAMPGTVPILASGPFIGIRGGSPGMTGRGWIHRNPTIYRIQRAQKCPEKPTLSPCAIRPTCWKKFSAGPTSSSLSAAG